MFDQVLADIGDQQSIEQTLSTFSAHIATVKSMVEESRRTRWCCSTSWVAPPTRKRAERSGSPSSITSGRSGCIVVASTHLLALKVYGANTTSVLNGSMGFDEETLQPTYLLRTGAPGKSAGLDIATRLGMAAMDHRARTRSDDDDRKRHRPLSFRTARACR